ncbi:MAG: sulfotransferase [Bdellovibrionota bacterium]
MKLFNCGLSKTGTTSIVSALKILNIPSVHSADIGIRIQQWCLHGARAGSPPPPELTQYDGFADGPLWTVTLDLLETIPDCKVIITDRDFDSWLNSAAIHVLANRLGATPGNLKQFHADLWEQDYKRAHTIYDVAFERYPNRVLRMNLESGDGWGRLCPFLGILSPPGEPFPFENTSIERLERMLFILKQKAAAHVSR